MLTAITRAVSPSLNRCELTYQTRVEIDIARAQAQHRTYEECLEELGARVISLPAEPGLPDSMFVEDPVVVVDEIAVINRMGAESRRGEAESMARALQPFRPLRRIEGPATLEGGDVLRMGKRVFVGISPRTNMEGIGQLAEFLKPFGYTVIPVGLRGCMHLKSACTMLADGVILAYRPWIDVGAFDGIEIMDVAPTESGAANVLRIGDTVVLAQCFPQTRELLEKRAYRTRSLDISELMKAESALTCSSVLFES
jgi:dimethylargininase